MKTKNAIRVTSHYRNFNGDIQDWKLAFYELYRYQMTWSFAYELDVRESRKNGVYVDLLIRPDFKEALINTMDSLGYGELTITDEKVGVVDGYKLPDDVFVVTLDD